jgi:hypothetical protein
MREILNMSAHEYYLQKYNIDISKLPFHLGNTIGSFFLEGNYYTKEEMEKFFEKYVKE